MSQLTLADISKEFTVAVVNRAFKKKTKSADTVERISVTRAAPAGEGLLGAVYRVHVAGKHISTSFIAKALVNDQLLRSTLNCTKYFCRETLFFSTVLPALISIQTSLGAKESLRNNVPLCFDWHCDGHNDYLILEDLAEKGFKSVPNPTIHERNETLKTIAHMHAVSLALRIKEPRVFTEITDKLYEIYYYEENRNWYDEFLQCAIKLDVAALAEYENPKTSLYYKKFIELLNKDVYSQLIDLVSDHGNNAVICHGDAWCPNFLHSKQSVAIDFQILRYASPVTDLSYYIFVSNLCRSKEDFNDAIEVYYLALQYYLADMGLEANQLFPRSSLQHEIKKYGKYGILASLSSFPLLASKRCDTFDSYSVKYQEYDRIPLQKLWHLTPFQTEKDKIQLVNAVRVAVDVGLI